MHLKRSLIPVGRCVKIFFNNYGMMVVLVVVAQGCG